MPLVVKLMKGESVDFGFEEKEEFTEPRLVLSYKTTGVYRVGAYSDLSRLPDNSIALLSITGPVTKYGDVCSLGSVDHSATMNRLATAGNIAGVIIDMDSPGGEAAGTAMLADAISNLAKGKPVITLIDDGIAASAGYWIASSATEIYTTQKTDMVGSIGVYQTIADWYGYFENQGLKVTDIYAPQSTEKNAGYREFVESGNDSLIKEELRVMADEFIGTVKKNRSGKLTSKEWDGGKMFYTKDAIRIGLIDGQKSFDQVVKRMNTLIQQKQSSSNSNKMSFEKTLSAAKAEQFEVTDEGFVLQEDHLNGIEAAIAQHETAFAALQEQHDSHALQAQQATAELATAKEEITGLKAEIETLKNADAATATDAAAGGDNYQTVSPKEKYLTSVDRELAERKARYGA